MADENILEIGALINLSQVIPGLSELVTKTETTTAQMQAAMAALSEVPISLRVDDPSFAALRNATAELSTLTTVLEQKIATLNAEIGKSETVIASAGSAENVGASIKRRYTDELLAQVAATDVQTKSLELETDAIQMQNEALAANQAFKAAVRDTGAPGVATAAAAIVAPEVVSATNAKNAAVAEIAASEAAAAGVKTATANKIAAIKELEAAQLEEQEVAERLKVAYDTLYEPANEDRAIAKEAELNALDKELEASINQVALAQAKVATTTADETKALELQTAAVNALNTKLAETTELKKAATTPVAAPAVTGGDERAAQTEQNTELAASEENVATKSIASAEAKEQTAVASTQGAAAAAGAVQANILVGNTVNATTRELAEQATMLRASGLSWEAITTQLMAGGASATNVATALTALKVPLASVAESINQTSVLGQRINAIFAQTGIEAGGVARQLQLLGLSGKDMVTVMLASGISLNTIIETFARLGIRLNATGNDMLKLAAASGATTEELEKLALALNNVATASTNASRGISGVWTNVNEARVAFGAASGSVGMMEGGFARLIGASRILGPIMNSLFPIFLAIGFVEILGRVYDGIIKITDGLAGNTAAVKSFYEEVVKGNEKALASANTVHEADLKLAEAMRTQVNFEQKNWYDIVKDGLSVTEQQRSTLDSVIATLVPLVGLYEDVAGVLHNYDDEIKANIEATKAQIALMQERSKLRAEEISEHVKLTNEELNTNKVGKDRINQLEQEISTLDKTKAARVSAAGLEAAARPLATGESVAEARRDKEAEINNEILEKHRQLEVARSTLSIETNRAIIDSDKSLADARAAQLEKEASIAYSQGKITLEQEVAAQKTAEEQKIQATRDRVAATITELKREAAETGKDTGPQIIAQQALLRDAETNHQTRMDEIKARGLADRLRMDEEYNLAVINGERRAASESERIAREHAKVLLEQGKLSEEGYTAAQKAAAAERRDEDIKAAAERRAAQMAGGETQDVARVRDQELKNDLEEAERKFRATIESIDIESWRRLDAERKRIVNDEIAGINDEMTMAIERSKAQTDLRISDINRAKEFHLIGSRTAIDANYAQVKSELDAEAAIIRKTIAELEYMEAAAKSAGVQIDVSKKIEALNTRLEKIDLEKTIALEKHARDLAAVQEAEAQKAANIISQSFTTAMDRMISEHMKFSQVLQTFWVSVVQGFERMGIQIVAGWIQHLAQMVIETIIQAKVMQFILSKLGQATGGTAPGTPPATAQNVAKVTSDTGVAAATVFTEAIETIPFPANMAAAPASAAAVIAMMAPFAAMAAAGAAVAGLGGGGGGGGGDTGLALGFAQGGIVPGRTGDPMTIVAHAKEMVLPPHISEGLQNAIAHGSLRSSPAITTTTKSLHMPVKVEYHHHGGGGFDEGALHDTVVNTVKRAVRNGALNFR